MTYEEKIVLLVEDYGLDLILDQNDLSEFDLLSLLVNSGLVDLRDYFFEDLDEEILNNED